MSHPPLLEVPPYFSKPVTPSNRKARILIAVVAALVVGASVVTVLLLRERFGGPAGEVRILITQPQSLGGRPVLVDPDIAVMAEELRRKFNDEADATNAFAARYGNTDSDDVVMAIAVELEVDRPERMLMTELMGLAGDGLHVRGLDEIGAGPMGGVAKCGIVVDEEQDDKELPVCGWADEGSLGIVIWYNSRPNLANAEFVELRGEIEARTVKSVGSGG